jgi:integrase
MQRPNTDLVFPNATGKKPLAIRNAFENAVERADIKNFRFHDLRHTFASYLAMQGASLLDIATVLGHKTLQMVQRYAHLSAPHTASIVAKMNKTIFGE